MDNDENRFIGVALIWLGAGFGIGLSNVNSGDLSIWNALISMSIAFGATIATLALMGANFGNIKSKRQEQSDTSTSDAYSNLLLQLMTDEERQAMRKRLINNVATDGELVSADERQNQEHYHSN